MFWQRIRNNDWFAVSDATTYHITKKSSNQYVLSHNDQSFYHSSLDEAKEAIDSSS